MIFYASFPQGLKPSAFSNLAARLNPCPFQNPKAALNRYSSQTLTQH